MNQPITPFKVLTIDGHPERLDAYREYLEQDRARRFTVLPAETGEKGLSLNRTFRPDCIVSHVALPDMDGRQLVSTLDINVERPPVALVMVAPAESESAAIEAMALGAQDYVLWNAITAGQMQRAVLNALEVVSLRNRLVETRKELSAMALNDPQTSLATRNLFYDRLTHAVILAKRNNQQVGLLMLEMSRLKEINLLKGHVAGDAALLEVGARLKASLREADTVGRLGGDKFAVVLQTGVTYEGVVTTAQKLISAMEKAFQRTDGELDLSLNIGVALFPNHGEDGDTLIHHAEAAMSQARAQGGGYAIFTYDDLLVDFLEGDSVA